LFKQLKNSENSMG